MFRQNLLLTLRTLNRQRAFSWINIAGLALGFAAAVFIADYVYHEYRYDRHHSKADRIARVSMHLKTASGYDQHFARITTDFVNELPETYPEVEQVIRFQNFRHRTVRIGDEVFKEEFAFSTDAAAFSVFDYPMIEGQASTALAEPYSVVLTAATAKKYFGTLQVMGRTLEILEGAGNTFTPYTVTAVIADIPETSHMPITLLTSFASPEERTGWAYTYLLLKRPEDIESLSAKMPEFISQHSDNPEEISLPLLGLTDIHLQSDLAREIVPGGNAWVLPMFSAIAFFILLLALINYMNLSTAQSLSRAREIGVRKVLGSQRSQLIAYFLSQSILFAIFAGLLGAGLIPLLQSSYQYITGFQFSLPILPLAMGFIATSILVGLGAGLYPAFRLSAFKPISVMKGAGGSFGRSPKFSLRHVLVGVQFAISLTLMVCAVVAYQQNRYLTNKDLGLQPDQMLVIRELHPEANIGYEPFKQALLTNPSILDVTAVMGVPSVEIRDAGNVYAEGTYPDFSSSPVMDIQVIDRGFLQAMGMKLAAGSDIPASLERPEAPVFLEGWQDLAALVSEQQQAYILNTTAAEMVGWTPEEAIGKEFSWTNGALTFPKGPVVGVVKDFHQESLHNTIEPMAMVYEPQLFNHILVKSSAANMAETMAAVSGQWEAQFPNLPLDLAFMDDLFAKLYSTEQQQMLLISSFSGIALFIALLGLLGLIAYSLKMRTSELAIRRILGAELPSFLWLMGREYLILLAAATLVSIPASLWILRIWLQNFSYRVTITPWPYVVAIGLLCLAFLLNITWQTIRHNRKNPAHILRNE